MCRKVVISGCGCISRQGEDVATLRNAFDNYRIGNGVHLPEKQQRYQFCDMDILDKLPKPDDACKSVLMSAEEAVKQAGVKIDKDNSFRTGIIIGTVNGVFSSQVRYLNVLHKTKLSSPILFQSTANNLLTGLLSLKYHIRGYSTVIFNGMTSALDAIILAKDLIESGIIDSALVGGCDGGSGCLKKNGIDTVPFEESGVVVLENEENVSCKDKILGTVTETVQERCTGRLNLADIIASAADKEERIDNLFIGTDETISFCQGDRVMEMGDFFKPGSCVAGMLQVILCLQQKGRNNVVLNYDKAGYVSSITIRNS